VTCLQRRRRDAAAGNGGASAPRDDTDGGVLWDPARRGAAGWSLSGARPQWGSIGKGGEKWLTVGESGG
jgi:hypothetical protein